jgi:hypothetical protein
MLLLGCKPPGRITEQHDIFFGIAPRLRDLADDITAFWPDAGTIHIDAWREVTVVDGYYINITNRYDLRQEPGTPRLFFINLGGYKPGEFEEYHYKLLSVGTNKGAAIAAAKETAFYKHTGFKGADSHVDDKYGLDVDDLYEIADILPAGLTEQYSINIVPGNDMATAADEWHLGYLKMERLKQYEG